MTNEYDANRALDEQAVKYSAAWLKPANHVYRRRKTDSWIKRLIRWIVGF